MKQFACGSVVPGCQRVFLAEQEDDILRQVVAHAAADHDVHEVSDEMASAVRQNIVSVA